MFFFAYFWFVSPADVIKKIKQCDGRGVQIKLRQIGPGMVQQVQVHCDKCGGSGEIINEKDRCKKCLGKKVRNEP
jgi:DnaJ-class molecular chaperone